jgi:hypothetical protein
MPLPDPTPGLVIHYSYLWSDEQAAGQREGRKDRPCAIILRAETQRGQLRVTVVPITHTPPSHPEHAVELPVETKRRLGLDENRSWIVVAETNTFSWPGPDLRPIPGRSGKWAYGSITSKLFQRVREGVLSAAREQRLGTVKRDE